MNPQITINVGSGGSTGSYSSSSSGLDQGVLPSPIMRMGVTAASQEGATLGQAGLPTPMMQGMSGDVQSTARLPTPMMQGVSGDVQSAAGLPTPMMQSVSGDVQSAAGLPTPMMQSVSGGVQSAAGLPTPMTQSVSGGVQSAAGLPHPSEKGHLGKHDQIAAISGAGGGDPMPVELQELMVLIKAEEEKMSPPASAEEPGLAPKRGKK